MGPISPPELKPDTSLLNGNSVGSFSPGPGSPGSFNQMPIPSATNISPNSVNSNSQNRVAYPPNHPLSGSKHLCSICGDRASGKHYGVYRYVLSFYFIVLFYLILFVCFFFLRFAVARDAKDSSNEPSEKI